MTKLLTEEKGLERDLSSKALLRTDTSALDAHRRAKQQMRALRGDSKRIDALEAEVAELKIMIAGLQRIINIKTGTF